MERRTIANRENSSINRETYCGNSPDASGLGEEERKGAYNSVSSVSEQNEREDIGTNNQAHNSSSP